MEIAGWIAPAATMIAAMMTAANLGPKITGWGFVVFTIGSLGWIAVAVTSGQSNLLWTNILLSIVNVIGIWRWLGREATLADGADRAAETSRVGPAPSLVPITLFQDCAIEGPGGATVAHSAGAMIDKTTGAIAYLIVREGGTGGVGERFHALAWDAIAIEGDRMTCPHTAEEMAALPVVDAADWPSSKGAPEVADQPR